jgi:acylphosphatase
VASIHLEIRGRVQGVGFRWFVVEQARALGVRGWVANRANGTVEVAAGGDPDALRKLEAAVRKGPPGAFVEDVTELAPPDEGKLSTPFAIAR